MMDWVGWTNFMALSLPYYNSYEFFPLELYKDEPLLIVANLNELHMQIFICFCDTPDAGKHLAQKQSTS